MKINYDDPVYPSVDETNTYEDNSTGTQRTDFIGSNGLTKLEYFSAMALQGILSNASGVAEPEHWSKLAVKYGRTLINELNKEGAS